MVFQRYQRMKRIWFAVLGLSLYVFCRASFEKNHLIRESQMERVQGDKDLNDVLKATHNISDKSAVLLPNACPVNLLGTPTAMRVPDCANSPECASITCKSLLFGNNSKNATYKERRVFEVARAFMKDHPRNFATESTYINLTRNCKVFKITLGYILSPLNEEEASFPIAFNIIMHRDIEHAERLLRAIYRPQNFYCIHVDAKAKASVQHAVRAIVDCFDNVFISSKLEKVVYGGVSRLIADLNCMRDHIARNKSWKYLINLAGQSFPLKTNHEIVQILKIYNGSNDIEGFIRLKKSRYHDRFIEDSHTHVDKVHDEQNPDPPHDLDIVKGSAYGVFSYKFVDYILNDPISKDLLEYMHYTWSPDELYWATLHHTYSNPHMKPPGGYSGNPENKPWLAVYVKWFDNCFGKLRNMICIFGVADLPDLIGRKELFCNKFDLDFEPLGLDCLEAWIKQNTHCPPGFDSDYYRNLPFVKSSKGAMHFTT